MLCSLCHTSLRNRLEGEVDYQEIVRTCKYDVMKLCSLIKKIYNGSTTVLVDDMLDNAVEALCSYLHLRGDEYYSFSKYIESSEQSHNLIKEAGASFVNDKIRDRHIIELVSWNQQQSSIRLKLKTCKEATTDGRERQEGRKILTEAMRARVYINRSGPRCVQFRR